MDMSFVVSYSTSAILRTVFPPIRMANPIDMETKMKSDVVGESGVVGTSGVDGSAISVPAVVVQGCTEWEAVHKYSQIFKQADRPDVVFCCEGRSGLACSCLNNLSLKGGK